MNERDLVYVPLGPHHKPHPAVVPRIRNDGVLLAIAGTGTERTLPSVVVTAASREAKALGFYKTTYFYESNIAAYPSDLATRGIGRCPPDLFHRLEDFARSQVTAFDAKR